MVRIGQGDVRRWTHVLDIVGGDDDVLGLEPPATHTCRRARPHAAYEIFRNKQDGCVVVVLDPTLDHRVFGRSVTVISDSDPSKMPLQSRQRPGTVEQLWHGPDQGEDGWVWRKPRVGQRGL